MSKSKVRRQAQGIARTARGKKLKFERLKKEAAKGLRGLRLAIRLSERKLKERAKKVSALIEKFNAVNEFGGVGNPKIEDDFDFDDAAGIIDTYLTDLLEVES